MNRALERIIENFLEPLWKLEFWADHIAQAALDAL
jgi:hypothetical protein